MRRLLNVLLAAVLLGALVGCAEKPTATGGKTPVPASSTQTTDTAGTGSPLPDAAYSMAPGLSAWKDPESGYDTARAWKLDGGEWPVMMLLSPSQAPQAIAGFEDGAFAQKLKPHDITPTLERLDGPERVFHALERSQWPFVYMPLAVFMDYMRSPANQGEAGGLQYVAIAGSTAGGGYTLVARAPGIKTVADLKGKTVGTPNLNPVPGTLLTAAVEEAGLQVGDGPDDVKIVMGDDALNRYAKGEIDAFITLNILKAQLLSQGSHPVTDFADVAFTPSYTVLVVERSVLEKRPEVVKAFLEAHLDSNAAAEREWSGAMPQKLMNSWNGFFTAEKTPWAPQRVVPSVDAYKAMLGDMRPEIRLDRRLMEACFAYNSAHKTWGWPGKVDTTKMVDYEAFNEVLAEKGEQKQ